jgi:hypothetical protein
MKTSTNQVWESCHFPSEFRAKTFYVSPSSILTTNTVIIDTPVFIKIQGSFPHSQHSACVPSHELKIQSTFLYCTEYKFDSASNK